MLLLFLFVKSDRLQPPDFGIDHALLCAVGTHEADMIDCHGSQLDFHRCSVLSPSDQCYVRRKALPVERNIVFSQCPSDSPHNGFQCRRCLQSGSPEITERSAPVKRNRKRFKLDICQGG